jgi:FkbM family methyltransferase
MYNFTDKRKASFCRSVLGHSASSLVFVDVGAGGSLKHPWILLPAGKLEKVDFEPEGSTQAGDLPLCISNESGEKPFYIARDPRASSLHEADPAFVDWFGQDGMLAARAIKVRCATLDEYFSGQYERLDFLDINVEGHDFQVLQGSERLFQSAFIKAVKIEFELAAAWQGQGWFGDIDAWMKRHGFELMDISVDRIRPACVRHLYHPGEPVWGKAFYVPGRGAWEQRKNSVDPKTLTDDVLKAVVLWTILDAPGRAVELLKVLSPGVLPIDPVLLQREIAKVFRRAFVDAVTGRAGYIARRLVERYLVRQNKKS